MINYFFFISERRQNEQGQSRVMLRALPNQITYEHSTRRTVPVRTDLRVQADSASLNRIVRKPMGTIWGIRTEGNTRNRASLKLYTRNNENYYRADDCVEEIDFEDEMLEAYNNLVGRHEPELPLEQHDEQTQMPEHAEAMPIIHPFLAYSRDFVRALKNSSVSLSTVNAIKISRLNDMLTLGTVEFIYEKNSDGSTRRAVGTRNPGVIRRLLRTFMESSQEIDDVVNDERTSVPFDGVHVTYFDIERSGWRSFTVDKFKDVLLDSFRPSEAA